MRIALAEPAEPVRADIARDKIREMDGLLSHLEDSEEERPKGKKMPTTELRQDPLFEASLDNMLKTYTKLFDEDLQEPCRLPPMPIELVHD